ncbi:MAG: PH domain-containing protein [Clostridia bacterium]|nr:PH domain-containing protein [Clostridia bacterium]
MIKRLNMKELKPKYIIICAAVLYAVAAIICAYRDLTFISTWDGWGIFTKIIYICEGILMGALAAAMFFQKEKPIIWASYLCFAHCMCVMYNLIGTDNLTNIYRITSIAFAFIAMVIIMTKRIIRGENRTILIFFLLPALLMMVAYYFWNKISGGLDLLLKAQLILQIVSFALAGFWKYQLLFEKSEDKQNKDLKDLSSAEEMYDYCMDNRLGFGASKGSAIKHFQVVLDNIKSDETIECFFMGLHNYRSATEHSGHFAYIMTDKRLIMGQNSLIGDNKIRAINLDDINDITSSSLSNIANSGVGLGKICFSTSGGPLYVGANVEDTNNIYKCVREVWEAYKKDL